VIIAAQECDATKFNSSNAADQKNKNPPIIGGFNFLLLVPIAGLNIHPH